MRLGAKVAAGAALVVVLAVGGGAVALKSMDFNQYKGLITDEVRKATGRTLTIAGDLDVGVSLTPTLAVDDVTLGNAEWGSRPQMVTMQRLEAEVELLPLLLSQEVRINRVILVKPDILLEVDEKGATNWTFTPPAGTGDAAPAEPTAGSAEAGGGAATLPVVQEVGVRDARLVYKDARTGETLTLVLAELDARAEGLDAPLHLRFEGAYNDAAFSGEATLGAAETLLAGDRPFPVDATLKAGGATLGLKGSIAKPAEGKGLDLALTASGDEVARLAELGGASLHSLGAYDLAARLSDPDGGYRLSDLRLTLGDSDLTGEAAVRLDGARPALSAKLASGTLDVAGLLPPSDKADGADAAPAGAAEGAGASQGGKAAGGKRVFPAEPLPVEALKAVDADIGLTAGQVRLPDGLALSDVDATVILKGGRLDVTLANVTAADGRIAGTLGLDGAASPARLGSDLTVSGLALGKLLAATGQGDMISGGPTDAKVSLKGRGASVAGIMAGLDGTILIQVGEGKINNANIDLAGADLATELVGSLNPLAKKEPYSALKCAVVNFQVKDGIATTKNGIALQTAKMNVVGDGRVNLRDETLAMAVRTEPREGLGLSVGNLSQLVRLQGTLAEPNVGIDPLGAGKTIGSIGAALATGGMSLLAEGLLNRATSDSAPCETALSGKAPAPASEPASSDGGATEQQQPESAGDVIKGIGDGLGKLFGN